MRHRQNIKLGSIISAAPNIRCGSDSYPVLSMTMHNGLMLQSDRFKKSIASADQSNYKVVKHNQLVVGFPIDEGVLSVQDLVPAGIVSPAYAIWDVDISQIRPVYLERYLRSPQSISYYKSKLRGTTARRRSLTTADLLALPVSLPTIEEQQKICATLDAVSELLRLRKAQLAELDNLVKSQFIEMFGDPMGNSKGWDVIRLDALFNVGSSKRIYQREQTSSGIPFLRISDLVQRITTGEESCELFISENQFLDLCKKGLVHEPGDILVTSRGTLGMCYTVQKNDRFYFQDGMISWLHKKSLDVNTRYISYLFQLTGFRKQIDEVPTGSTVNYLSLSRLAKLNVMYPPIELQDRFITIVEAADKSKSAIQKALDETQRLFDSLMAEYFEA